MRDTKRMDKMEIGMDAIGTKKSAYTGAIQEVFAGKVISFSDGYYELESESGERRFFENWMVLTKEAHEKRYAPRPVVQADTQKCSCGHTIQKSLVMSSSMGSCCPDCYDRMSE